jgi:hypothetical protein
MTSRPEPCDVGDHYSCERTTCRCSCHPRHGRRTNSTETAQVSNVCAAHWHAPQEDL